jgi:hypothetical protein
MKVAILLAHEVDFARSAALPPVGRRSQIHNFVILSGTLTRLGNTLEIGLDSRGFRRSELWQFDCLDLFGETEHFERPYSIPIHINFVPLQAVTR